jgi:hypothetical protein
VSFKKPEDILQFLWKTALREDEKQRAHVNQGLRETVYAIAEVPFIKKAWVESVRY